jgi:hypothetical protein
MAWRYGIGVSIMPTDQQRLHGIADKADSVSN